MHGLKIDFLHTYFVKPKWNANCVGGYCVVRKYIRPYAQFLLFMLYPCQCCCIICFVTFKYSAVNVFYTVSFKHVLNSNWPNIYHEIFLPSTFFCNQISMSRLLYMYVHVLLLFEGIISQSWLTLIYNMHITQLFFLLQYDKTNFVTRQWLYFSTDRIHCIMNDCCTALGCRDAGSKRFRHVRYCF